MCRLYTHFVHIYYDAMLPMPPGRDLLSLPLTTTSGTAKLQAGPIGSMKMRYLGCFNTGLVSTVVGKE